MFNMEKKLVFVSYDIVEYMPLDLQDKLKFYQSFDINFWTGTKSFSHARYGQDYCPWKIEIDNTFISTPNLDSSYKLTFEEITNQRSIELLNLAKKSELKIGIYYSGGIDSTVILAAMIKNYSFDDLKYIDVFMNHYSVIENPVFYEKFIKNRLNIINVDGGGFQNNILTTHIICDGEPGDKIWMSDPGITFARYHGFDILQKPIKEVKDLIVSFLTRYMTRAYAIQWFEIFEQNIKNYTEFVDTVGDLFSWINYNCHFVSNIYNRIVRSTSNSMINFKNNYHPWFNTVDYQKWAWGAESKQKNNLSDLSNYKMLAKNYIFDLSKDRYFLQFKTKLASNRSQYMSSNNHETILAMFSDGSTVTQNNITPHSVYNYLN